MLLDIHSPLLDKCKIKEPDVIELSALAAMLHSFYSGIENIFKRVAKELDGEFPKGEAWHRKILELMTKANDRRKNLISSELGERLKVYLDFRHMFRNAYTFNLRWEKMKEPVMDAESTLKMLEMELDQIFADV